MNKSFLYGMLMGLAILLSGCATTEYKPLPDIDQPAKIIAKKEGIYHKVQKGQTLWRISKAYNVPVEEVIAANNIPNAAAIEVDQLILIPGASSAREISPATVDQNKDEFAWPLKGKVISYFNDRKGNASNRGIDIEAQAGDKAKATREGRVILADYMSGYGQTVMIDHGDGFISIYAQNSKLLVKLGDYVYKGDAIAEIGNGGRRAYLHFQIRKGIQATNPMYYLS